MAQSCLLSTDILALIEQISTVGGRQTISLTVEAAIEQNSFILSLWQTFIITNTAIWTGLITYRRTIPIYFILIVMLPYFVGLYINGHSLFDAYIGLEALYEDIQLQISSQNLQSKFPNLYNYYSINRGLGKTRAAIILITHVGSILLTIIGVYMHFRHNQTTLK